MQWGGGSGSWTTLGGPSTQSSPAVRAHVGLLSREWLAGKGLGRGRQELERRDGWACEGLGCFPGPRCGYAPQVGRDPLTLGRVGHARGCTTELNAEGEGVWAGGTADPCVEDGSESRSGPCVNLCVCFLFVESP